MLLFAKFKANFFAANIAVLSFERIHSFVFHDHDSLMSPGSDPVFVHTYHTAALWRYIYQ